MAGCENENLMHRWWEGKLVQQLWRATRQHLKIKNKHTLRRGSSVPQRTLTRWGMRHAHRDIHQHHL